jgi:hypothetical protein
MSDRRRITVMVAVTVMTLGALSGPAAATVHEITAAYCSGGNVGNFEGNAVNPPGLGTFGSKSFARPVLASGAVDGTTFTTTDRPQVKVLPDQFAPTLTLTADTIDHPSEHCAAMRP